MNRSPMIGVGSTADTGRSDRECDLAVGQSSDLEAVQVPLIRPEETLWTNLCVLQRERCDWPDALNVVSALGPELDWSRLGTDTALRTAVPVFAWICLYRAWELPVWLENPC
jgi:hypothetical protein